MNRVATAAALGLFLLMPSWLIAQQSNSQTNQTYNQEDQTSNAQATTTYYPQSNQYNQNNPSSPYRENHGEVGVFADYFRLAPGATAANYVGVGGRVGFNVNPHVALEGEMSYDFARNYTTTFSNGTTTAFAKTSVRPITGLFGPKFQFGTSGPFRFFLDGKVGFVDFSTTSNSGTVNGSTFSSGVQGIGGSGTHVAFYPGAGVEGFFGPIGLRLDVGDEVYLNNGAYNNLRVTLGPTLRF